METKTTFENISTTERWVRFVISVAAIVGAVESTIGAAAFAAINFAAIALATTAIIGWDPMKSGVTALMSHLHVGSGHRPITHGR